MYNIRKYSMIILSLIIANCIISPLSNAEETVNPQKLQEENEKLKRTVEELKQRINRLEPAEPVNLQDPPWEKLQFPSNTLAITDVINKGTMIPFDLIVDKPEDRKS